MSRRGKITEDQMQKFIEFRNLISEIESKFKYDSFIEFRGLIIEKDCDNGLRYKLYNPKNKTYISLQSQNMYGILSLSIDWINYYEVKLTP